MHPWFIVFPFLIPICALMIPIIAILTRHQQKMAEIMSQRVDVAPELNQIRIELGELRSRLNQQALAIDNLENSARLLGKGSSAVGDQSQNLQENLRAL